MGQEEQDQRIDYVEFAVPDIARARSFFEKAFGWQFTDYGPQYTSFSDGRMSGGFREAAETSGGGPLVVLYVTDLKAAQERIVANGGKIVVFDPRPVELPCAVNHVPLAPERLPDVLLALGQNDLSSFDAQEHELLEGLIEQLRSAD